MKGIIDVGGGMRGIYTSGVYDCFIDKGVRFDYYLGVSAGSANLITYLAGQRGRTKTFYTDYSFRKEYMSLENMIKNGSFINVEYIFGDLSRRDGENPLDYEAFSKTDARFYAVATRASDGKAVYFSREHISQDDYAILKASCSIPGVCRPYKVNGELYYDGGVADPIPLEKAVSDGCDKIVLVLTKPVAEYEKNQGFSGPMSLFLRNNPLIVNMVKKLPETNKRALEYARQLEEQGKLMIIEPGSCLGLNTLTRNRELMEKFYLKGYEDALKALERKEFFNEVKIK